MLGYLILFLILGFCVSGYGDPGEGFYIGCLLLACLIACANCVGLILAVVAVCRPNGRMAGFFGLLLNGVPAIILAGCLLVIAG